MLATPRAPLIRLLLPLAFLLAAGIAEAHLASDSYLRLEPAADGNIAAQWEIALRDLDVAVGLDADADGSITWRELRTRRREIESYAFSRLAIGGAAGPCRIEPRELLVDRHAGEAFAVIRFAAICPPGSGPLTLGYRLLFDIDPTHRGILTIVEEGGARSEVLSPARSEVTLGLAPPALAQEIAQFFRFGIDHILLGYDHLLFVAVLLIVAPLRRAAGSDWTPIDGLGGVALETLKILTAFTLAHALTMTLATVASIEAPARLVEPAVAATIMLAAADNIRPLLPRLRWAVAFVFGLVHGISFAAALAPAQLPPLRVLLGLGSFNLGVEAGQIALALLLVPTAFVARRERAYARVVAPALSAAALLLALVWFADRLFLLDLPVLRPLGR